MKRFLLLCFLYCTIFSSCISNKKHLEAVQVLKMDHEQSYTTEVNQWKRHLRISQDSVKSLQLQLAERKGENNILVELRRELISKINSLEGRIENVSSTSESTQQTLSSTLQVKEQQIASLKKQLQNVEQVLDQNKNEFGKVSGDLRYALQEMGYQDFELLGAVDHVKLIFPAELFFKKRNASKVEKRGLQLLEEVAKVINRHPIMNVRLTGHTDNSETGNKLFKNNWSFSAQQAATLVDYLTLEFDVSTAQLLAAGKGEAEPRSSNATPEGKALNKRIEFIFTKRGEDLDKAVRKEIQIQN